MTIDSNTTADLDLNDSSSIANVYYLLARLWNHEVDADAMRQLTAGPIANAYRQSGGWLPSVTEIDQPLIDSLAIEYCQCFLGPKEHLPPHQSVVAVSRFQGDCCDSIKEYAKLIEPPNLFGKNQQRMVDHAAVLLTLLGKLHIDLQASIDAEDEEAYRAINSTRREFFQQHAAWLIEYCSKASSRTQSPFFDGLFHVTGSLLNSEPS